MAAPPITIVVATVVRAIIVMAIAIHVMTRTAPPASIAAVIVLRHCGSRRTEHTCSEHD